MRVDPDEHRARPFRAHAVATDAGLRLHDVWELEQPLPDGVDLDDVEAKLREARPPTVVSGLFALRSLLGRTFRLDRGGTGFLPVYVEPAERLYRNENRLVAALAHVAVVDRRVRLAIYVRPRGRSGRLYLRAIEPVRRYVLYPSLIRWAGAQVAALAGGRPAGGGRRSVRESGGA